mgnify:CR=1 FL=1
MDPARVKGYQGRVSFPVLGLLKDLSRMFPVGVLPTHLMIPPVGSFAPLHHPGSRDLLLRPTVLRKGLVAGMVERDLLLLPGVVGSVSFPLGFLPTQVGKRKRGLNVLPAVQPMVVVGMALGSAS